MPAVVRTTATARREKRSEPVKGSCPEAEPPLA
jgi:hypothetical protein